MWKHANKCAFDGKKNFIIILCKTAVDEVLAFRKIKHESYYNTIYQWNSKEYTVKMYHEEGILRLLTMNPSG